MSYRHRGIVKFLPGKKGRRYRNLRQFYEECPARGVGGNLCEVTNLRKLKDGSGLATVKTRPGVIRSRAGGTWRLHFASYSILKQHLKKRVTESRKGMLDGAKRGALMRPRARR
jgi:hypothetical protein